MENMSTKGSMEGQQRRMRASAGTINIMEQIAEARVQQLIEEENKLAAKDAEIQNIKDETLRLIGLMEIARVKNLEEERRGFRNEIIVLNLRLVTQVLKKYGSFTQDKFQNGSIGLLKAAETFNSAKGVPFGNYACFCIETEIRMAWGKQNRAFEGKQKAFLDSLDDPSMMDNGDGVSKHDMVEDATSMAMFDQLIEETETDVLFYDIIMPCIETYGKRSKEMNMELWQQLELQYFMELSVEASQRKRITFTEMAVQLGTTPQNLRIRHRKVLKLVQEKCREMGYDVVVSAGGRARVVYRDEEIRTYNKRR
jgi:hypothetical protein